jgi:chromosome segregation ATPase
MAPEPTTLLRVAETAPERSSSAWAPVVSRQQTLSLQETLRQHPSATIVRMNDSDLSNKELMEAIIGLKMATENGFIRSEHEHEEIRTELTGLRGQVAGLDRRLEHVETDVAVLKTDVAVLKTDVAVLNVRITRMDKRLKNVEATVKPKRSARPR